MLIKKKAIKWRFEFRRELFKPEMTSICCGLSCIARGTVCSLCSRVNNICVVKKSLGDKYRYVVC